MESKADRVKTKRERNVNYTREENEKLVSLIESKINIIENKKNDAGTWHEKENAWKAIEMDFNRVRNGTVYRDAKHLKLKYEALKREIRKKCRLMCAEGNITASAGGMGPLTPIERRVKEIIILTFEGNESFSDPDPMEMAVNQEPDAGVITNNITVSIKQEENYSDTDSTDYSTNIMFEMPVEEPLPKKRCLPHENGFPITPKEKDQDESEISEPTEKRPLPQLAEEQLEIVNLQRQLIEEELEERKLKKEILREELKHKKLMFALEKEQILLKIEILKLELGSKKML